MPFGLKIDKLILLVLSCIGKPLHLLLHLFRPGQLIGGFIGVVSHASLIFACKYTKKK